MFQVLGHELGFWESLVFLIGIGGGGYVVLALWCWLWDEVLWPRITCHKIVEVEHLDEVREYVSEYLASNGGLELLD